MISVNPEAIPDADPAVNQVMSRFVNLNTDYDGLLAAIGGDDPASKFGNNAFGAPMLGIATGGDALGCMDRYGFEKAQVRGFDFCCSSLVSFLSSAAAPAAPAAPAAAGAGAAPTAPAVPAAPAVSAVHPSYALLQRTLNAAAGAAGAAALAQKAAENAPAAESKAAEVKVRPPAFSSLGSSICCCSYQRWLTRVLLLRFVLFFSCSVSCRQPEAAPAAAAEDGPSDG